MTKLEYINKSLNIALSESPALKGLYKCTKPTSYIRKNTYWSLDVLGEVSKGSIIADLQDGEDKRGIATVEMPIEEFIKHFALCG